MSASNGTNSRIKQIEKPDPGTPAGGGLEGLARRTVVVVLVVVLIFALAYLCVRGANVLLVGFAGVLLALFLTMLSETLTKYSGLPHSWSLSIVILGLTAVFVGLVVLLANRLSSQASDLSDKLPEALEQIRVSVSQYPVVGRFLEQLPKPGDALAKSADLPRVTGLISGLAETFIAVIVVLFVGIFGAAEPAIYREGLAHIVPYIHRKRVEETVDALEYNLRRWIVVQGLLMVMVGSITAVGLWLIGVPEALVLGLMAGLLELVPYLGPWIAVVPSAMIAFLVGPWYLGMTLGLYLGIHLLEAYLLLPLLQRRAVLLPPALGLVAQLLFGQLFGILGLMTAAPLTLAVLVLVKMLYVEDTLGDEAVEVPGEPGKPETAGIAT